MSLDQQEIKEIIRLRETGHSLPEIRRSTKHSNGTVFRYIQGVKIKPKFLAFWRDKRRSSVYRKIQYEQKAKDEIDRRIKKLRPEEKMLIAASLYWAEGTKKDFVLVNTDPSLIQVFIRCLSEFAVSRDELSISLRLYSDLDIRKAMKFWSEITGIPSSQIAYVTVLKDKKDGKLRYGMCRVRVKKGGYILKLFHQLRQKIVKLITLPVPNLSKSP